MLAAARRLSHEPFADDIPVLAQALRERLVDDRDRRGGVAICIREVPARELRNPAFIAGAIAAVTGFGIGSVLTPLLAVRYGMKLAVAVVAVPHLLGTIVRFWMLRACS